MVRLEKDPNSESNQPEGCVPPGLIANEKLVVANAYAVATAAALWSILPLIA